jgi:hypothetical protein
MPDGKPAPASDRLFIQPSGFSPNAENIKNLKKIRPDYYEHMASQLDEYDVGRLIATGRATAATASRCTPISTRNPRGDRAARGRPLLAGLHRRRRRLERPDPGRDLQPAHLFRPVADPGRDLPARTAR